MEGSCLLHLLCFVHSGIRSWACGAHQTAVHIFSLASLAWFPCLADLSNKHLHRSPVIAKDGNQMCCFCLQSALRFSMKPKFMPKLGSYLIIIQIAVGLLCKKQNNFTRNIKLQISNLIGCWMSFVHLVRIMISKE